MQRTTLILACFFVCFDCFAQISEQIPLGSHAQYPFVNYTPREGLVNNRARFVFQDSKGKLYIATFGGLSVYDGSRFTNYNTNNGLAVNLVNDVVEMGDDSIWVVPNDNRVQYISKGQLKNFIPAGRFTPLINQLIKASNGKYYAMADEGLFVLQNKRFMKLLLVDPSGSRLITTLLSGGEINGRLYIIFNPGYKAPTQSLLVYDLRLNKVIACSTDLKVLDLFSISANQVWISTPKGLFMPDDADSNHPLNLKPLPDSFHIPKNLWPHLIYKDRQKNLWLGAGNGVYKLSKHGNLTLFTKENGLTTDFQTSIFQDFENNMWFTNEQTGLCKLSNPQLAYYPSLKSDFTTSDIFIAPGSDSVWLFDGTHSKIMLMLPGGGTKQYAHMGVLDWSLRMVSAKANYLFARNKLYRWHASPDGKYFYLTTHYIDSNNTYGFTSVISDKNNNLIGVSNKVVVLADNKTLVEPINYMADQVTIDANNRIWTAHRANQLFCFQLSGTGRNAKLTRLGVFNKPILGSPRSIVADHSGNIWIGTRDQGLYRLHFDGLKITSKQQLTTINGLSENFISYLYCDKDNNIWACTPSGLDRIETVNDHFSIENVTGGNNLYFPVRKIQQTRSGLFWILTDAGVITYNPSRLTINDWKPHLTFLNTVITKTGHVPMPANKKLLHFQNNLSFQLSAPTYIDEKQTRFSYLLEGGGNENWSTPSTDASINFVNLPPGNYTLKTKAIFLHGLYPDAQSSFSFTILPPWWQTWWFRLVAALLIIGLLVVALRFYYSRKLEKQKIDLEKKRAIEKERTRIATDMHDDLGAGLSRIKFLSETIGMKKLQHLPIEEEISSIRTYSHEMIDKMGEIVWALNEKNDTLSDLLSYTRAYAVEYLQENGIVCHVEEPDNIPQTMVSGEFRRNIYLTVKETLHNIVKHAEATEVHIKIEIADWLSIQISDDGKGIDITPIDSPGNGLFNMNKRIQGLNGRFTITSNNGTQINIEIPLNV